MERAKISRDHLLFVLSKIIDFSSKVNNSVRYPNIPTDIRPDSKDVLQELETKSLCTVEDDHFHARHKYADDENNPSFSEGSSWQNIFRLTDLKINLFSEISKSQSKLAGTY